VLNERPALGATADWVGSKKGAAHRDGIRGEQGVHQLLQPSALERFDIIVEHKQQRMTRRTRGLIVCRSE
jgi:hypothetical protein